MLRAARFVEEPFEHQRVLRGHRAKGPTARVEIRDDLFGGRDGNAGFLCEPASGLRAVGGLCDRPFDVETQIADGSRELVASGWRLAEPERKIRRRAFGIRDADHAGAHLQHPPRRIPELKHVAAQALDRKILVQRADERVGGVEDDAVVGDLRNRAARRDRQHAHAAAGMQPAVHLVAVKECGPASAIGREPVSGHGHDGIEGRASEIAERPGPPDEVEQFVVSVGPGGGLSDDLLGQHIERRLMGDDRVQLSTSHGAQQGSALDEIVPRRGEEPALGRPGQGMPGSANPLEERRNPVR